MNLVFSTYNSYMKMTKTLSRNWGTGNAVSFDGLHGVPLWNVCAAYDRAENRKHTTYREGGHSNAIIIKGSHTNLLNKW